MSGRSSFGEALKFWLKLGFISFGGPAGQIAIMHRELVEQKRWISERRFLHALNYCMLLPGPEAQQLATYIGWLMHRTWGGIVAGALFVLPSLFILIALSWVYVAFGEVGWVAGHLLRHQARRRGHRPASGVAHRRPHAQESAQGAAAVGDRGAELRRHRSAEDAVPLGGACGGWRGRAGRQVLARAVRRWRRPCGGPGRWRRRTASATSSTTHTPHPPTRSSAKSRLAKVVLVGALLWLLPMAVLIAAQGWDGTLTQMGWFFTKAALLTFGGAYAVLPYVYQGAVEQFHWLTGPQMIDGLALGETTPGPLDHGGGLRRLRRRLDPAGAGSRHALRRRGAGRDRGHLVHLPAVVPVHPGRRPAGGIDARQPEASPRRSPRSLPPWSA